MWQMEHEILYNIKNMLKKKRLKFSIKKKNFEEYLHTFIFYTFTHISIYSYMIFIKKFTENPR